MASSEGSKATLGECLATGLRRSLPLLGVAFLSGLGIGFGLLLLVVPGVFLLLMWSVAAPVTVAERRGVIESMGRSSELTSGARWNILALFLIIWVIMFAASSISGAVMIVVYGFQGLATAMKDGVPVAFFAINAVISTVVTVFAAAMPTSSSPECGVRRGKAAVLGSKRTKLPNPSLRKASTLVFVGGGRSKSHVVARRGH
jgi:hypothetical protein